MSDYQKMLKIVGRLDPGFVLERKTLLTMPSLAKTKQAYIETLRLYFTRAGYFVAVKPGRYKRTKKKINMFMTYTQLQEQAYPGTTKKRKRREKFYREYERRQMELREPQYPEWLKALAKDQKLEVSSIKYTMSYPENPLLNLVDSTVLTEEDLRPKTLHLSLTGRIKP